MINGIYIQAKEIGGGLVIQHGFTTMLAAKSIGENCWINQQVTIGFNGHGSPPIIGANAVVINNVETGAVMGGVPAMKLKG